MCSLVLFFLSGRMEEEEGDQREKIRQKQKERKKEVLLCVYIMHD